MQVLTLPYIKADVYKHWWDDSLSNLKYEYINSHQAWFDAGKPRFGPLFQKRNSDENNYRSAIKLRKHNDGKNVSNSLLHSLYNKNSASF